jgi:hypothetical protein
VSQGELVAAYLDGQMSRRTLIRRLVAAGVSFGAAVSYAHVLGQGRAQADRALRDQYGILEPTTGKILDQSLDEVIETGKVRVRFSVPRRARVEFRIWVHRPSHTYTYSQLALKEIETSGPVIRKELRVPLKFNPPHSVDALRPLDAAPLDLVTVARKGIDHFAAGSHQRTLT